MSNNSIIIALFSAFAAILFLNSLQTTQQPSIQSTTPIQNQVMPSSDATVSPIPSQYPQQLQIPSRHRFEGFGDDE